MTDSTGHVLYKKEDASKGKFAFTTDDYDMYRVCVESEGTLITFDRAYCNHYCTFPLITKTTGDTCSNMAQLLPL